MALKLMLDKFLTCLAFAVFSAQVINASSSQTAAPALSGDISEVTTDLANAFYDFINDPKISGTTDHMWSEFNTILRSKHGSEVIKGTVDEMHYVLTDATAHDAIEHILDTAKVVLKNKDGVKVLVACLAGLVKIHEGKGIDSIHTFMTGMSKIFADPQKRETVQALTKGLYEVAANS